MAEKCADDATKFGLLLLKVAEADAGMKDRTTVADLLAGSTEANFTNYARKTGITATVTVDQANDRVDVDMPDQTFTAGASTNNLVKAVIFYEEAAADATRIPLVAADFVYTTDTNDFIAQVAAAGFYRAS